MKSGHATPKWALFFIIDNTRCDLHPSLQYFQKIQNKTWKFNTDMPAK